MLGERENSLICMRTGPCKDIEGFAQPWVLLCAVGWKQKVSPSPKEHHEMVRLKKYAHAHALRPLQ